MRTTRRIRVALAAITLAATGAALLATAAPASAAPTAPAAPSTAGAPVVLLHGDACGPAWGAFVPDSGYAPFYFNFHEACHWHDSCYDSAPWGRNEWGRLQCDNGFLGLMVSWCNNRYAWWNPGRGNCTNVATAYYAAVRAGGAFSFY